jgi:hypothetical protein
MVRDTTQANALFSALQTNYYIYAEYGYNQAKFGEVRYTNCTCATSSTCTKQSVIYDIDNKIPLWNVPGFYVGCYVIESLLRSSLECFYDPQCIQTIRVYLVSPLSVNVTPLNASLSIYSKESTIRQLLDNLMIEKWNATAVFEKYYNECRPTHCTYSFTKRHDLIFIATTLFGIAGGLITVLNFIIPRLIKFIRKEKQQQPTNGNVQSKQFLKSVSFFFEESFV